MIILKFGILMNNSCGDCCSTRTLIFPQVNCKKAGFWTCDQMRVGYYPDIKVFRYGWTSLEYLGARTKGLYWQQSKNSGNASCKATWYIYLKHFPVLI